MPRRLSRAAPASSPEAEAPGAAPKRRASARLSASHEIKRVKSTASLSGSPVKSTTKKSKYFEPETSDEPASESSDSDGEESGSAYEEKVSEESSANDSEPEEPSDSEEESKKSRAKGKQGRGTVSDADALKGKELWREGVRTGLGPGKEVFIPKPKARDPGNVAYRDETLHPNTRLFLLDLAKNNDRQWFKGEQSGIHETSAAIALADWVFLQRMIPITARQRRILRRLSSPSLRRSLRKMPLFLSYLTRTWYVLTFQFLTDAR